MIERRLKKGELVWGGEIQPNSCVMLVDGDLIMIGNQEIGTIKISIGHFVGDFPCLLNNKPCHTSVRAISDSIIFEIDKGDFVDFLRDNPGLLIFFNDKFIVE